MTDEDERMDRARRIREMREGSRPDDAQADDNDAADADDGADPEAEGGADSDADDGADPEAIDGADPEAIDGGDSDADGGDPAGDDESTMHVPGAEVGDIDVDVAEMAEQAGLTSADDESVAGEDADAPADAGDEAESVGAVSGVDETAQAGRSQETRVLEFSLGDEQYCLDIEYVEEIVKRETVTRVPNTPDCVEGVVDLRGQITTILDPKVLLEIGEDGAKELIVVFDPEKFEEQGAVGWVVDDVDRVMPVSDDEVNSSPVDQDHVNGVVDRDDDFVIWTTPELDVEELAG